MVGSMSAEEKLRAVQLWNILSEKLQEIVNNSAADINALAFPPSQEQVPAAAITTSGVPPSLFFYPAPSKTPFHNAPAEDDVPEFHNCREPPAAAARASVKISFEEHGSRQQSSQLFRHSVC